MKSRFPYILIILILLVALFFEKCESPSNEVPSQSITYEEANVLEEEFKRTRSRVIDASLGYQDTREFWFSLDTLKDYIHYVEHRAKKQKLTDLGIRIYFAAYPNDGESHDPGYSTVVLVPTSRTGVNPIQQGFAPIAAEDENIENINALNYSQGGKPPKDL